MLRVARAVATAEAVLVHYPGKSVYCLNEIVHNRQVVSRLTAAGMVFVKAPDAVPEGARLLFSAHGVAPEVHAQAAARRLRVIDATCPFVTKVHHEVRRFAAQGACVVCIGHRNHEEVVGVAGEAPDAVCVLESAQEAEALHVPQGQSVAVVTQTTLGEAQVEPVMMVLRRRFGQRLLLPGSTDVCYATRNRQQAVCLMAAQCSMVLVLGSENSSNSQRLVETARRAGARAHLISAIEQMQGIDFAKAQVVGVTSGASTPESFLDEGLQVLRETYGFPAAEVLHAVKEDSPVFRLPTWAE